MSPSQHGQLILLELLPEELWQHFTYHKPPKGKSFIYFPLATHVTRIGWRASSCFLRTNCIPGHATLVPPSSQRSVLAPALLQLVLPTGAAESWEMTISAKCTETRQGKEKILLPSPRNPRPQQTRPGVPLLHHVPSVTLDQHPEVPHPGGTMTGVTGLM